MFNEVRYFDEQSAAAVTLEQEGGHHSLHNTLRAAR